MQYFVPTYCAHNVYTCVCTHVYVSAASVSGLDGPNGITATVKYVLLKLNYPGNSYGSPILDLATSTPVQSCVGIAGSGR